MINNNGFQIKWRWGRSFFNWTSQRI